MYYVLFNDLSLNLKTYPNPTETSSAQASQEGTIKNMNTENIIKELNFKAIRSGGAGGQHVNKVSSKVVLFFDISKSQSLSEEEKEILIQNIHTKLTKENILILNCDESRSQHKNKEIVIERFLQLISKGLKVAKKRKATKPSKTSIKKRLDSKKKHHLKKVNRKKPDVD